MAVSLPQPMDKVLDMNTVLGVAPLLQVLGEAVHLVLGVALQVLAKPLIWQLGSTRGDLRFTAPHR